MVVAQGGNALDIDEGERLRGQMGGCSQEEPESVHVFRRDSRTDGESARPQVLWQGTVESGRYLPESSSPFVYGVRPRGFTRLEVSA